MDRDKLKIAMKVAEAVSIASHDDETKVGAVLVRNDTGAIIATGFNGFIRGAPDSELPTTRPDKYSYMQHAEKNIIFNCARHGISMENCFIVCTMSPCTDCVRALWQCGITHVVVRDLYKDWDKVTTMKDLSVEMGTLPNGYIKLTYKRKT